MSDIIHVYQIDLDGVLANFAKSVKEIYPSFLEGGTEHDKNMDREMWKAISKYQKNGGEFWYDMSPMEDAFELWDFVKASNPEILTACGNASFNAGPQKIKWVAKIFDKDTKVNLVEKSKDKAKFATPTTILIDDKMKSIQPFRDAGGIGILHTSAKNTIEELKKIIS